jgi:F-type H+-transporting ATPase subunit alpha
MFASDLDAASRQQLERGQRLMELLKQAQYAPFPVEEQVVSIWTGTTGKLDPVPTVDVRRFESEFLEFLRSNHKGVLDGIRESGDFDDDTEKALTQAYTDFTDQFETSEGGSIKVGREEFEQLGEDEVQQEQIVKQKRG